MKVCQCLVIIQKPCLRHEVRHHVPRPGCFGFKMNKMLAPERRRGVRRILDEELFDPCRPVGWRHPGESEVAVRLEMPARFLEGRAAFFIHEPGGRFAPDAFRIGDGRPAVGLDMQRPAGAEPAEEIVHAGCDGYAFFRRRAFKIGSAIETGPLQAAILVEDDARSDQAGPF